MLDLEMEPFASRCILGDHLLRLLRVVVVAFSFTVPPCPVLPYAHAAILSGGDIEHERGSGAQKTARPSRYASGDESEDPTAVRPGGTAASTTGPPVVAVEDSSYDADADYDAWIRFYWPQLAPNRRPLLPTQLQPRARDLLVISRAEAASFASTRAYEERFSFKTFRVYYELFRRGSGDEALAPARRAEQAALRKLREGYRNARLWEAWHLALKEGGRAFLDKMELEDLTNALYKLEIAVAVPFREIDECFTTATTAGPGGSKQLLRPSHDAQNDQPHPWPRQLHGRPLVWGWFLILDLDLGCDEGVEGGGGPRRQCGPGPFAPVAPGPSRTLVPIFPRSLFPCPDVVVGDGVGPPSSSSSATIATSGARDCNRDYEVDHKHSSRSSCISTSSPFSVIWRTRLEIAEALCRGSRSVGARQNLRADFFVPDMSTFYAGPLATTTTMSKDQRHDHRGFLLEDLEDVEDLNEVDTGDGAELGLDVDIGDGEQGQGAVGSSQTDRMAAPAGREEMVKMEQHAAGQPKRQEFSSKPRVRSRPPSPPRPRSSTSAVDLGLSRRQTRAAAGKGGRDDDYSDFESCDEGEPQTEVRGQQQSQLDNKKPEDDVDDPAPPLPPATVSTGNSNSASEKRNFSVRVSRSRYDPEYLGAKPPPEPIGHDQCEEVGSMVCVVDYREDQQQNGANWRGARRREVRSNAGAGAAQHERPMSAYTGNVAGFKRLMIAKAARERLLDERCSIMLD